MKGFAKIPTEKKTLYMELNRKQKEAEVRKEIQNILEEETKAGNVSIDRGSEWRSGNLLHQQVGITENAKDYIQEIGLFLEVSYCAADGRVTELLKYRGYRILSRKRNWGSWKVWE